MGKSTISMAIFNSYVCLPEGIRVVSFSPGRSRQPRISTASSGSQWALRQIAAHWDLALAVQVRQCPCQRECQNRMSDRMAERMSEYMLARSRKNVRIYVYPIYYILQMVCQKLCQNNVWGWGSLEESNLFSPHCNDTQGKTAGISPNRSIHTIPSPPINTPQKPWFSEFQHLCLCDHLGCVYFFSKNRGDGIHQLSNTMGKSYYINHIIKSPWNPIWWVQSKHKKRTGHLFVVDHFLQCLDRLLRLASRG